MSGQLKSYAETFGQSEETKQMFSSDKWIEILGKYRMCECKERKDFNSYYKLTDEHNVVYIDGFCYMMREEVFHGLLLGQKFEVFTVEDKGYKKLRDFMNQDGAEIVAMVSPYGDKQRYKNFIFALEKSLWEELNVTKGR